MPRGQLFINGVDVYEEYGISMDNTALSALMTPAAKKNWITNEVRDQHGTQYLSGVTYVPKMAARDLTLTFNLVAQDEETFLLKYAAFCTDVLDSGLLDISTSFQPDVVYKCKYVSCTQFSQFRRQIANFQLKLIENDPSDRDL